jgi:amino acid efflux transporter
MAITTVNQPNLTTARGAALYIGAILGPGLLLLPGLAAAEAGPASILAWLGLLGLSGLFAAVFSALGRKIPSAGGVMGYVAVGLGPRAGRVTGWIFLAGVVGGAPIVCLIGASYVTELTGGGQLARAAVAAFLLLTVIGLAAAGLRASASAQLVLVSLLAVVVVVAVAGSATASRVANWTPFAPHGWLSIGSAAATLMFSFAGWEAVAPLTTQFKDPARQLPRAVGIALAATTVLYLGLAVATISVLGPRAATDVPLAGLLSHAIGAAGPDAAAVAAIVLTLGATNAYINGAAAMTGQLVRPVPGRAAAPMYRLLAAIAAAGLLLITAYGLRIVNITVLVAVPSTLFLTVYLGAMTAAARILRGPARLAALPGALAVAVMLVFCGWALALPAAVALTVACRDSGHGRARRAGLLGGHRVGGRQRVVDAEIERAGQRVEHGLLGQGGRPQRGRGQRRDAGVRRPGQRECGGHVAGHAAPPGRQVRHLDAEPGLDETQQRGVVEHLRAHETAPAERRDDQAGDTEPQADGTVDPARGGGQGPGEPLPLGPGRRGERRHVIEEPAVLVVRHEQDGLRPDRRVGHQRRQHAVDEVLAIPGRRGRVLALRQGRHDP